MDAAQIRDQLLAEILDGDPVVEQGFDEYATVRRLGVPRAMVREALSSLAESGLLRRAPRVGTALANPLFYFAVEDASAFAGSGASSIMFETVSVERVTPPASIARDLRCEPESGVIRIQRVTHINGRMAEHWTIWSVLELPAEMHRDGLPRDASWYEVVGSITGEAAMTMTRRTVNGRATMGDISLLDVQLGDPLRFVSRSLTHTDGRPIDRSWGRINSQVLVSTETFTIRV